MIEIRYCGVCGDYNLVEKIKDKILDNTNTSNEEIEIVECGSCSMKITMDGETVFNEKREFFDIYGIVEQIRSGNQAYA